jgi:hypothetical protein
MDRVNVGAAIEQERDRLERPAHDRAMQRMASCAIRVVHESWIGVEKIAHTPNVPHFRG